MSGAELRAFGFMGAPQSRRSVDRRGLLKTALDPRDHFTYTGNNKQQKQTTKSTETQFLTFAHRGCAFTAQQTTKSSKNPYSTIVHRVCAFTAQHPTKSAHTHCSTIAQRSCASTPQHSTTHSGRPPQASVGSWRAARKSKARTADTRRPKT